MRCLLNSAKDNDSHIILSIETQGRDEKRERESAEEWLGVVSGLAGGQASPEAVRGV